MSSLSIYRLMGPIYLYFQGHVGRNFDRPGPVKLLGAEAEEAVLPARVSGSPHAAATRCGHSRELVGSKGGFLSSLA